MSYFIVFFNLIFNFHTSFALSKSYSLLSHSLIIFAVFTHCFFCDSLTAWPLHLSLLHFPGLCVRCVVTAQPPLATNVLVINIVYLQLWRPGSLNWRLGFAPSKNP